MKFLGGVIKDGTLALSSVYPETEAREMVLWYVESALGHSRHTHLLDPLFTVSDHEAAAVFSAVERMLAGEPVQYVTGEAFFYGRRFRVNPSVLIPRQETEILCRDVGRILGRKEYNRVLDLCTGSGCIAWTLALENPETHVDAVDISDDALAVAMTQSFPEMESGSGVLMPGFKKADVLGDPSSLNCPPESYDVLVSNPPYVMDSEKALMRSNVLDHEPHLALFVPDDDPLVFYRAIAGWAAYHLKPGGFAMVEVNEALGVQTAELFAGSGFSGVRVIKDLNDKDRFVSFVK